MTSAVVASHLWEGGWPPRKWDRLLRSPEGSPDFNPPTASCLAGIRGVTHHSDIVSILQPQGHAASAGRFTNLLNRDGDRVGGGPGETQHHGNRAPRRRVRGNQNVGLIDSQ